MEGRPELKEVGPLNRVSYHPGIIKIARGIKKPPGMPNQEFMYLRGLIQCQKCKNQR